MTPFDEVYYNNLHYTQDTETQNNLYQTTGKICYQCYVISLLPLMGLLVNSS